MTNLKNKLDPLSWQVSIVTPDGRPTPEFMRKWSQQVATNGSIIDLTNAAGVSDVLDLIGAAQGDVLYRDASAWRALAPGTVGQVLTTEGVAANPAWKTPATPGFGFFIGGLMLAGEILGGGQFPVGMTFTTADALTEVQSEVPAAASAVLNIQTWIAGVRATVGTITFAAGGQVGTVAWTASPYTLPAFTILELHAPSSADLTLAWVTGTINGVAT